MFNLGFAQQVRRGDEGNLLVDLAEGRDEGDDGAVLGVEGVDGLLVQLETLAPVCLLSCPVVRVKNSRSGFSFRPLVDQGLTDEFYGVFWRRMRAGAV